MPFDADDLAVFYDEDMPGYVLVSPAVGQPFAALLRSADRDVFDSGRAGTHSIRYLGAAAFVNGDVLTIASGPHAGTYAVHGLSKRLNGSEFQADLVKQ